METQLTCEQDACLSDTDMIDDINRNAGSLGWKAHNYTQFYGKKLSEGLSYRLGTFEPRVRVKSMSRLGHNVDQLPINFNSLNNWPWAVSDIPDQGWCNSSWAVSTGSVSSDRIGISLKKSVDLSSQHLLSCVKKQQGCAGGHLDNAWRYLNKLGYFSLSF
jgi:Papain family cysteine protease